MADELVGTFVDRAATKADADFYIAQVDRAIAAFEKLKEAKAGINSNSSLSTIGESSAKADKAAQDLIKSQNLLIDGKRKQVLLENELLKQAALQQKAAEKLAATKPAASDVPYTNNLSAIQAEQSALEKTGTVVNDLDRAQAQAANSATAFGKATIETTKAQKSAVIVDKELEKAKADLIKASGKNNLQIQSYKVETQAANRAVKEQALLASGLLTPYEKLSKQYLSAAKNAKDLAVEFGHNSVEAIKAAKEAKALNTQLQTIDKTVGQSQRNVGNYGSAFNKLLGPIRTAANILPGLGISGIFLLGFEAITAVVEKLDLFNTKLTDTAAKQKLLGEVVAESNKNVGKEITTLQILYDATQNVNLSTAARTKAAKELQETYPETFKNFTTEEILLGNAKAGYDELTKSILKTSLARAAKSKLDALSTEELDAQEKKQKAVNAATDDATNKLATYYEKLRKGGGSTVAGSQQANEKLVRDQFRKERDIVIDEFNKTQKDIAKRRKILTDFVGVENLVNAVVDLKPPPKEKKEAVTKESTKATLDSDFELYKIAQERKIKLLEDGSNNEKFEYDKRLAFLRDASIARLQLIDETEQEELRKNAEKEAALTANLKKAKGTERNNLEIELKNTQTARAIIEAKFNTDRLNAFDESEKKLNALAEKEKERYLKIQKERYERVIKLIEDNGAREKAVLENQYAANISALQESFDNGEISQRSFNRKRIDLEFEFQRDSLVIEIETARKKIAVSALLPTEKGKALNELAKLERQLSDATTKHIRENEKAKLTAALDTLNTIQKTANDVFGVIDGIFAASAINQKNKLEEQRQTAEDNANRDIELANRSALTEEQKAARIIVINARLAAQKQQIAQKEKKVDEDRARFAKAQNIFNIILSTAQAVIKQLAATPLPYGAGFVAAVAALGAAQLATAIATPIPKYRHGRSENDPYEGPAYTNDGGKDEVIERKDGRIEFPQGRNVLVSVKKGDKIHPDKNAWMDAMLNAAHRDAMRVVPASASGPDITGAIDKQTRSIVGAIKNKREITIKGVSGRDVMFRDGSNSVTYLNNSLQ